MKKLIFMVLAMTVCIAAFGQAKKPTIMVVPSDNWCIKNGYVAGVDDTGRQVPDYQKALQNNEDMRLVITEMGGIMARRDFPMKSLEAELKQLAGDRALMSAQAMDNADMRFVKESNVDMILRSAKADIIVDIDFTVVSGMRKQVTFNVQALDAYSSKIISGNTGASDSSATAAISSLLGASVASFMDQFTADLQRHFDDIFANGREIRVVMQRWNDSYTDFESIFSYNGVEAELADIIEVWMMDSTVNERYSLDQRSANVLRFSQVRIPLFGKNALTGREMALDSRSWINPLSTMLRGEKYGNIPTTIIPKGLGEVWLIMGEK